MTLTKGLDSAWWLHGSAWGSVRCSPGWTSSSISSRTGGGAPIGALAESIRRSYGSFDEFRAAFTLTPRPSAVLTFVSVG